MKRNKSNSFRLNETTIISIVTLFVVCKIILGSISIISHLELDDFKFYYKKLTVLSYNQLQMIHSREILESERILSNAGDEELTEDIKTLILNKKYSEVVEKGLSIPDSKHRYAVMGYGYLGLREWKNLL